MLCTGQQHWALVVNIFYPTAEPPPLSETRSTVRSASSCRRTSVATASCVAGSCWRSVWVSSRPASSSPEWVALTSLGTPPWWPFPSRPPLLSYGLVFILLSPDSTCWTSSAPLRPATPPTAPSGWGGRWWTGCEENLPPGWSCRCGGVPYRDSGVRGPVCQSLRKLTWHWFTGQRWRGPHDSTYILVYMLYISW